MGFNLGFKWLMLFLSLAQAHDLTPIYVRKDHTEKLCESDWNRPQEWPNCRRFLSPTKRGKKFCTP